MSNPGHGRIHLTRYVEENQGHTSACWIWRGPLNNKGYGRFDFLGEHFAHRAFYRHHVGPIPEGMTIDHLCWTKTCVNPEHMEVVTALENHRRWAASPRERKTHCTHGHEFTPDNARLRKDGARDCRECQRQRRARTAA